jgi:hypothetical protein
MSKHVPKELSHLKLSTVITLNKFTLSTKLPSSEQHNSFFLPNMLVSNTRSPSLLSCGCRRPNPTLCHAAQPVMYYCTTRLATASPVARGASSIRSREAGTSRLSVITAAVEQPVLFIHVRASHNSASSSLEAPEYLYSRTEFLLNRRMVSKMTMMDVVYHSALHMQSLHSKTTPHHIHHTHRILRASRLTSTADLFADLTIGAVSLKHFIAFTTATLATTLILCVGC